MVDSADLKLVAPPVGAWIETSSSQICATLYSSRPPWARGLKPLLPPKLLVILVAPPVGAWIETKIEINA